MWFATGDLLQYWFMLEIWQYSPFEDVLDEEEILWGILFGMGVEAVVHACGYNVLRIEEIFTRYGCQPPTRDEIDQVHVENLSPYSSLIPCVE